MFKTKLERKFFPSLITMEFPKSYYIHDLVTEDPNNPQICYKFVI